LTKPSQSRPWYSYEGIAEWHDSILVAKSPFAIHFYNKKYQLLAEVDTLYVNSIYTDSKNRLWAGTFNGLKQVIQVRDKNNKDHFSLQPAPFKDPVLQKAIVSHVLEDDEGNIWVATNQGLVKIFPDGTIKTYTEKNGLPSRMIHCIYQDREKNIWIGTIAGLATLVSKGSVNIYAKDNGYVSYGNNVMYLFKNDHLLVTGTGGSHLYDIKSNNLELLQTFREGYDIDLLIKQSPSLQPDENNPIGNYVLRQKNIQVGGNSYAVSDKESILFAADALRLTIKSGNVVLKHDFPPHRVQSLTFDSQGYLWIGTWNMGLYRATYKKIKDSIAFSLKDFSYLLPDRSVRSLYTDNKGNIWVGTRYKGLMRLTSDGHDGYKTWSLDYSSGIMSNYILTFSEDAAGNMWVGTYMGLDKLIPEADTFRVFNFSRINSYSSPVIAMLPRKDNSIWCITSDGLVHIADRQFENRQPLPVIITNVSVGDSTVRDSIIRTVQSITLNYRSSQAQFEFTSPDYINEKQILYNYRLLGSNDTSWSKPSNTHRVSYASLQPGNYRFEVRTLGWNGNFGSPTSFVFIITPPYWRTGWFYLFISILGILLLYAIYRYRISQFMRVQKIRNRIATDLHDDIGSTLTNISILSELSRQKLAQQEEAGLFLDRIAEEVNSSNQALDDIVWSINTENDTLAQTITRMRRYAAEIFDGANIHYSLHMDEHFAGRKLNMEQRRDSFLIFKEAINNIYKHAQAKNVYIKVWMDNNHLYMNIRDDGKGFDTTVSTNRNGIKNINHRTEKWKGTIQINSSPGKGTEMLIHFPIV
jgi:two-component sensor histidine kinase